MERLRTFGIVAHIDAGKTTLTERILYDSGSKERVGSVDDGTASTDWLAEERSRGISIEAAAVRVAWRGCALQVVDTPGHVDFIAEVERCLWVLDGVVVVLDAGRGIESQTRTLWAQVAARELPRVLFLNKLDRAARGRAAAEYQAACQEVAREFGIAVAPLVVPLVNETGEFAGLCHALTGAVQWFVGAPSEGECLGIAKTLRAAHDRLLEMAADLDPSILHDVVHGARVAPARILAVLVRECLASRCAPAFAGAALHDRGVDWLLDGVVDWLPSPATRGKTGLWATARAGDALAAFAALVFKVDHRGAGANYVRVVRGRLRSGATVERQRGNKPLLLREIGFVQAETRGACDSLGPGEIGVLAGDLGLRTGDVLLAPGTVVHVPPPTFPEPVLVAVVEPGRAEDLRELVAALRHLAADDPTLRVESRDDLVQVRGMGELHLEIMAERLRGLVQAPFTLGTPRVDRRTIIGNTARQVVELRTQAEGQQQRAKVELTLTPQNASQPAQVRDAADAPDLAAALRVELHHGLPDGPLYGAEVALEQVTVEGGEREGALAAAAARRVLLDALRAAGASGVEPEVTLDLWCPESGLQPVLADLGARGAQVTRILPAETGVHVEGKALLARMLGYVTKLRSMTKGLGRISLQPTGWAASR